MNKQALCNYKRIVIFSGTSDGRILSEELAKRGIYHTVCVATDYGDLMQPKNEYTIIHEGRMDEEKMREYMDEGSMIIDATHPYATEVTANIRSAANNKSCEYIRVVRESAQSIDSDVFMDDSRSLNRQYYRDYESMAHALNDVEGNILITTGSKELKKLTSIVKDTDRLYVRVLPSLDSIRLCEQAGIRNDHIIAMHGPFNEEMNTALLRQYNISCLVTKESGTRGGFMEKLSAAAKVGASCYICGRPTMEEGLSVDEALMVAMSYAAKELKNTNNSNNPGVIRLVVNIIGMGMGSPDCITVGAKKAIDDSDIVFGAARLIEEINGRKYPYYLAADILPVISDYYKMHGSACSKECGHNYNELTVSVLFSGDIGFFSGAKRFEDELNEWAQANAVTSLIINRYPGISSVSYLASKLGISYSSAPILSLHGRNDDANIRYVAERVIDSGEAFVLLSSGDDLSRLANEMSSMLDNRIDAVSYTHRTFEIIIGSRLSYEDEKLIHLSLNEACQFGGKGLFTAHMLACK